MNQIEKSTNNLSSPNKNTRYEACEELRATERLPEPAIAALEAATHDLDPLVAEAARLALATHKSRPPIEEPPSDSHDLPLQENSMEEIAASLPGLKKRIRWLWFIFALLLGISLVGEFASIALSRKGWTRISEINGEDISSIWTLSLAPDGAIWIGTGAPARVYRFDGTSWKEYTTDNSLSENNVRAIAESPGGELWISTDNDVYRFDGINWTSFTVADGLPFTSESISIAPDGSVWVAGLGSQFGNVSRFNGKTWTSYPIGDYGIVDIAISTDNIVWAAASEGLFRFDGREWITYKYKQSDMPVASPSISTSGDQIWVSNYYGVVCFDGKKWIDCPVADFIEVTESPDGSLWFVSQGEDHHVNLSRFENDNWTFYTSPYVIDPLANMDLVADQQGRIWVSNGDILLISNPNEIVSSNISMILLGWNNARYGLFALTGIGLIILLININKSIRQDQKIYKGLLFLIGILGSLFIYFVGIATIMHLFGIEFFTRSNLIYLLIYLSCLIPFTAILVGLFVVFRASKAPARFMPIYVVVSGSFFAEGTAFLILYSEIPTPAYKVWASSGAGATEAYFLIFTPILFFGVLALGGMVAYAITKGLRLNTTYSQITVALLTGLILGTLIGVALHFEFGNFTYVLLALTAIALVSGIVSGIVILIRNKKPGGAGKGNAIA